MNSAPKRTLDDLAVFGGTPLFDGPQHVGRPNLGDRARLHERLDEILDRRWLSNDGPLVRELEGRLAAALDVPHCALVTNGTVGLEILLRALGVSGEVIVPSFTFVASAHAAEWLGLEPVFCDVDPESFTLDPERVEEAITERTGAILGVHLWGRTCDVEALTALGEKHGIPVLFDAAHSLFCSQGERRVGGFGAAEVFSFHATKFFNTFEGGAITTRDEDLARRIRLMRNFGFAGYDEVTSCGTNGKMSEVCAAMGLTVLEDVERIVETNRSHFDAYERELGSVPGIRMLRPPASDEWNHQYVVALVEPDTFGLDRDTLQNALQEEGVLARRYFHPGCHRMEPYASRRGADAVELPVTEWLSDRVLALPTGTAMPADGATRIGRFVRFLGENASAVAARLA